MTIWILRINSDRAHVVDIIKEEIIFNHSDKQNIKRQCISSLYIESMPMDICYLIMAGGVALTIIDSLKFWKPAFEDLK